MIKIIRDYATALIRNTSSTYTKTIETTEEVVLPDETITVTDSTGNSTSTTNPVYDDVVVNLDILPPEEKLDFIFTIDTTLSGSSPSDSFTLNLLWGNDKVGLIKWGDGTQQYYTTNQTDIMHQYATSGIYDITIRGSYALEYMIDRRKIIKVKQWGRCDFASCRSAFQDAINLQSVPQDETFFCSGTDFTKLFFLVPLSNFGKISVAKSRDLDSFFRNTNFDYNIGDWNVANVNFMPNMFLGTSMSVANCDAILTGWTRWANGQANITLKQNVSLHMGNTDYTRGGDAEDAFNYLVNTLNWTITFG